MTGRIAAWKLALPCALSLLAAGWVGSALASAQARPQPQERLPITEMPRIVSGNDLGFRIEGTRDGFPIGRLVIRLDGRWVETGAVVSTAPVR